MGTPQRRRRCTAGSVALVAAGLLASLAPTGVAAADPGDVTIVQLTSGGAASGQPDPHTGISLDGGVSFRPATVVHPVPAWDVLPGTGWVSDSVNRGLGTTGTTTLFRREFMLPAGMGAPRLEVCLHADNSAAVRLNGTLIGRQFEGPVFANFQGPPECFRTTQSFVRGLNVLEFAVQNYGDQMGLDYRATLAYTEGADPVLALPQPDAVVAPDRDGAVVTYQATATDPDGGTATVQCDPPSGSVFPVGVTTVECTATDDEDATSTGSFEVLVTYANRPPVLTQPDALTVDAVGPGGAPVSFGVPAVTDDGLAPSTVACDPPSGSVFPIGGSTVTCVATDDEGLDSAPVTFTVTVRGAADQLADLLAAVTGVGPGTSLADKVRSAAAALEADDAPAACDTLGALLNQVQAQSGKSLSPAAAAAVTEDATRIRSVLGC